MHRSRWRASPGSRAVAPAFRWRAPRRLHRGLFADILRVGLVASRNAAQTVLTVGLVGRHASGSGRLWPWRIGWTGALAAAAIVGTIGLTVALAPDLWRSMFVAPPDTAVLAAGGPS